MSFSDECNYLSELISDYKQKIKDPFWEGLEELFIEMIIQTERKLYLIKEQELCQNFKQDKKISQFLSISQN